MIHQSTNDFNEMESIYCYNLLTKKKDYFLGHFQI